MSSRKVTVVLGAVLWLSFSAAPAARADDGGLLGDAGQVVGDAGAVADSVVQTVPSTTPPPLSQPVEAVVPPPLAPVTNEVVDHVAAVEEEAEQAVEPVVRIVEPTDPRAGGPAEEAVHPAVPPSRTRAAPGTAAVAASPSSPAPDVSLDDGPAPVAAGAQGPGDAQRPRRTAQRASAVDTARRPAAAPRHIVRVGDDHHPDQQQLWTLTNQLMHMWAGVRAPTGVDAGLAGDEDPGSRAPAGFDVVPLLWGLVLGIAALVLARRGGPTARPSR